VELYVLRYNRKIKSYVFNSVKFRCGYYCFNCDF